MNMVKMALSWACAAVVVTLAAAQEPAATTRSQVSVEQRFKQWDKNGDGKLTTDELREGNLFRRMDANGDGVVTLDEAKHAFPQLSAAGAPAEAQTAASQANRRAGSRFRGASEAAMKTFQDLRYKDVADSDPNATSLDVYAPAVATSAPVMIFVHGGGWQAGDKRDVGVKPGYIVGKGFVFVSVNYGLHPKVSPPALAQAEDVAAAIAWTHSHVAAYGGDPGAIFLMGHSAGAHLVSIAATNERFLKQSGKDLAIIKGVIELDTQALDVPRMMKESPARLYDQAFGADEKAWRDLSPIHHVAPNKGVPPFLMAVASNNDRKLAQSRALAAALEKAGVRAEIVEAPDKNHGTLNSSIGAPGDKTTDAILRFLDAVRDKQHASKLSPEAQVKASSTAAATSSAMSAVVDGAAMQKDVEAYCALGEHRAASPVDLATSKWLEARMRQSGLKIEIQSFTLPQFVLDKASLEIDGASIDVFPPWPPKATGPAPIIAPLEETAGEGSLDRLRGKIALFAGSVQERRGAGDLAQRLASAGAKAAVVVVESATGELRVANVARPAPAPPIPILLTGPKDGQSLRAAARRGAQASLLIAGADNPNAEARNIIGTLDRGPKRIVVSTPYSGWFRCGGERGSGLAVFLAVAQWAASYPSSVSYTFVASSAHELGYAGMQAFMKEYAPAPDETLCWIHLGANVAVRDRGPERPARAAGADDESPERGVAVMTNRPGLEPLLQRAFAQVPGATLTKREPKGELMLVLAKGYAGINIAGGGNTHMHAPGDGPGNTGPDLLAPAARAFIETLAAIESN